MADPEALMETLAPSQGLWLYLGPCDGYLLNWEAEGCKAHPDRPHIHTGLQWPEPLEMNPLFPVHLTWITENAVVVHMQSGLTAEYERSPGTSRWEYNAG